MVPFFRNPELLENITWLSLVKTMKTRKTVKDPYEAARKYLPPNSTINCPFDKADEEESKKKRTRLEYKVSVKK
jgi:hypothetical protein